MRLSPLFTLSLLLTTWQTAFAVTTDDCSKIKTDAERLACFDNISKQNETSANAEAEGDGQKSKWKLNTTQSKMDDSTSYSLTALSDNKIDGGMDDSGYGAVMIGCSKRLSTTITFTTGDVLASDEGASTANYRLDKERAHIVPMLVTQTHDWVGLWTNEYSVPFIKKMFGHDKLLIEVNRYGRTPAILEFSLKGLEEAIKPIRQACNW